MASGGRNPRDSIKRTAGVVDFACERYGFIELTNKNISISKVYFDHTSFPGEPKTNLSERYPRGTKVLLTFVPTQGEHKVKHRGVNIIKVDNQDVGKSNRSAQDRREIQQKQDKFGKGCENYLAAFLVTNGAKELSDLNRILGSQTDNCPKVLRNATVDDLVDFARQHSDLFTIKCEIFCLVELEDEVMKILSSAVQRHGSLKVNEVRHLFRSGTQSNLYLFGRGDWRDGLKNYIMRNAGKFVMWDSAVWGRDSMRKNTDVNDAFQKELEAVKFYSEFVLTKDNGILPISSLAGHAAQASPAVKEVASSKAEHFREFLDRNSFFFNVIGGERVKCEESRVAVIDTCWRKIRRRKKEKGAKSKIIERKKPDQNYDVMKAFTDMEVFDPFKTVKPSVPCSDFSESSTAHYSFESYTAPQPLVHESIPGKKSTPQPKKTKSKDTFREIVGNEIHSAVKKQLSAMGQKSFNNLLLLRLNVGKPPTAKIFDGEEVWNISLEQLKPIEVAFLQKIVRSEEVVKTMNPSLYGVRNSLHSIRVIEQNGKICGLTLFCQVHEDDNGLETSIINRRKFTAVLSDPEVRPLKFLYNYLRTKCNELSKTNDVLVIDVDGQLSGCDPNPHPSLGNITRLACSSSELMAKINDVIQHSHDYVILIGCDTPEVLQTLRKMCSKGVKVIAEVPVELKENVETMFAV